jgi:hypothetical protein
VSAKSAHNIDKLKTYLEVVAKKIVEERATHMHLHANTNSNIGNNCNIGENKNDTIFGKKVACQTNKEILKIDKKRYKNLNRPNLSL